MKIEKILHATFLVSDLKKARTFYEGTLGLSPDPGRPDLGYPGVWYDLGSAQQIHLIESKTNQNREGHPGSDRHLALSVSHVDHLAKKLSDENITHCKSRSGRKALFCRDPDGNALEFSENQPL